MKITVRKNVKVYTVEQKGIKAAVEKDGFKPFKTTIQVDGKKIHFMGDNKTHEIWIIFKSGKCFCGYNSMVKTEDYTPGTDKISFLKFCAGQAVGLQMLKAAQISFTCAGKEGSIKSVVDEAKNFFND